MKYENLGNTDIVVSKLCFGSLTISPLQSNLKLGDGVRIIEEAFERGVNFIDTAELYENYSYIKEAIKSKRDQFIIATKSYAYSHEGGEKSLKRALTELDTDYIDIFSLHEQESEHTLRGHSQALEYLTKARDKGYIRALGISTHNVAGVRAALKYDDIQIIHPIYNKAGLGITDGTILDMQKAIEEANAHGKGIYSMKPLGGGNLLSDVEDSISFVLKNPDIHSVAVGMQSTYEVVFNTMLFEGKEIPDNIRAVIGKKQRKLLIDFWCEGCGACVAACKQGALSISNNRAVVDSKKCVLCGYCSRYCKEFCIKII